MPVITRNQFGKGHAYYVATRSDEEFYRVFLKDVCKECGMEGLLAPQEKLEATMRENEKRKVFVFAKPYDRNASG